MRRVARTAIATAAGVLALSLGAAPVPATGIPPHAEEVTGVSAVFPDFDNRLIGFLNFTRAEFCAWVAAGAVGPPPYLDTSMAWTRTTGTGETSGTARGHLHLELWPMDDDAGGDPCQDTMDAAGPFATGRADVRDAVPLAGDDGHGARRAKLGFKGELTSADGDRYRYLLTVITLEDGQGRLRHLNTDHQRLVALP